MTKFKIGDRIQFKAVRILKGNPVIGTVISFDDEWVEVKLAHDIGGMVNDWEEGEIKSFRLILIANVKVLSE